MASPSIRSKTYHVSVAGSDDHPGNEDQPFRTIQHAADLARPGDTITVHEGVYRERVNPPRGGHDAEHPITYQAADGEHVQIKGSERVQGWERCERDCWTLRVANTFFGDPNPYQTQVTGDWFRSLPDEDRIYHTGAVYLEGHWLQEAASVKEILESDATEGMWFGETDETWTTLTARFPGVDPNQAFVEINVRESVFYPDQPGRNYITVRGFVLEHAACNWAPPTAEQIGLIGTHWSKGWVIEHNVVRYAMCSGISLGKYGDDWDNRAGTAEGYVGTIRRAHEKGWNRETIGHHTVRNNTVSHCEQAGIVGSMGAAFSLISGNTVHAINLRKIFAGEEMAGIKFHGAIDSRIEHNHIHHCGGFGGMWLDWMTQGTRIHGNLFHDNADQDLFVEVNHGPFLVDHNLFLSGTCLLESSGGGAYVHNLFAGDIVLREELERETPCHPPHSTEIQRLSKVVGDDERFFNNLFCGGTGLSVYADWDHPHMKAKGNLYLHSAKPSPVDEEAEEIPDLHPDLSIETQPDPPSLLWTFPEAKLTPSARTLITSETLGTAVVPGLAFEDPEGHPYFLDQDILGNKHAVNPAPGPFAQLPLSSEKVAIPAGAS